MWNVVEWQCNCNVWRMKKLSALVLGVSILLFACNDGTDTTQTTIITDSVNTEPAQPTQPEQPPIRLVLSITDRQVAVLQQNDTIKKYPIAVGKAKNPTPTGEFKIHQIDWNPDWNPPDSEWSEDEEYTPPGHADNPMGKVRIIYQMPYTLHGTKNLKSLGKAQSHGSVRMANLDAIELAKLIMERSGSAKPPEWYDRVLADSTKMETVKLRDSIPLTNRQ
jgi:murein L,D-transpeptidase YcbB/YkuD